MPQRRFVLAAILVAGIAIHGDVLCANGPDGTLARLLDGAPASVVRAAIGVTRRGTTMPLLLATGEPDYRTEKTRVVLVGGLDGRAASVRAVLGALRRSRGGVLAARLRGLKISAVPCVYPDALEADDGAVLDPAAFPPAGEAYGDSGHPEAAYLWRWIGMHAPDLVVDVRAGETTRWSAPRDAPDDRFARLAAALGAGKEAAQSTEFIAALGWTAPSETGLIPALRVETPVAGDFIESLVGALVETGFGGPSPARREIQRRLDRSPLEVARQLGRRYGHELKQVAYIPALALIGRARLSGITGEREHLADVKRIVQPYIRGDRPTFPQHRGGSHISGHLVFSHLARVSGKSAYIELARVAADLGFDARGEPLEVMPHHAEMSDSVFMGGPILAEVGRLTGEARYFDMCLRHVRHMTRLNVRVDGLHRHSPLDSTAWGRGNGFPAIGLALCLDAFPREHPGREELAFVFRAHLRALSAHQDVTGCWHQVIDHPGSYRELTCTCMITFAMVRGIRLGVLDVAAFEHRIARAWAAIRTRVAPDARLVDVCTGTGKQSSLRAYLDRRAILGDDARGGAMALLVATEMAEWESERSSESK